MKKIVFALFISLSFIACEKDEIALPALNNEPTGETPIDTSGGENIVARGSNVIRQVNMGSEYGQQLWFDFGTNQVIQSNNRTAWDIALSCAIGDNTVYLNSSNISSAAISNETDFAALTNRSNLTFNTVENYDVPSLNVDSLAIGDVTNENRVIVIDRGYSESNQPLGFWKLKFISASNSAYTFLFGRVNDTVGTEITLDKNPLKSRLSFSFNQGTIVDIEPPKENFDVAFTQFTNIFYEPQFMAYSVNGVLLNTYRTDGVKVFDKDYADIDLEYARSLFYTDKNDVIGYDWKYYDLQGGSYSINTSQNYIIKDAAGNYYKLHFLDFYDQNGVKGAPSFEYQRL